MTERLFPASATEQRFDGSKWRIFPTDGGAVVLTASGQQLLRRQPFLIGLLDAYRKDIEHPENPSSVRRWFKSGGNSDVYALDDQPIVIKESSTSQSVWSALDRTDYLYTICADLPPHIRVPEHYGAVFSSKIQRQYLAMRKANEGITVEAVQESSIYSERVKREVEDCFGEARALLDVAIARFNSRTGKQRNLLPDWHQGNVIVDFSTPTPDVPFSLWIIDQ